MTELFFEDVGRGPPIVLLHGWGLSGAVWTGITSRLAARSRVIVPDLAGHGRSRSVPPRDLETSAMAIVERTAGPAMWIAWSLGALVALTAALRAPAAVHKLVLVGATPKFVQAADWDSAMSLPVLHQFSSELAIDYRSTLQRFLSLQAGTGDTARASLRRLREMLFLHGEPDPNALRVGLEILRDSDMRSSLPYIANPTLVIHGSRDTLAPIEAGRYLAEQLPHARLRVIDGAGHAPFLSHEQMFLEAVEDFIGA